MKYTASDIVGAIRAKYSDGQRYVVCEQVCCDTGARAMSWIDAAVFCLWPSDGQARIAFEVKVSRGDFLNEIRNPTKNRWARESFHYFNYVAPKGIIKPEELPDKAGLIEIVGEQTLRTARAAAINDEPAIYDGLVAAFMRSVVQEKERKAAAFRDNDHEFKRLQAFEADVLKAARAFIPVGQYERPQGGELIRKIIEHNADGLALQAERRNLIALLDNFQDQMVTAWLEFSVITHAALLARDEFGRHVVGPYSKDKFSCVLTDMERRTGKDWERIHLGRVKEWFRKLTAKMDAKPNKNGG